MRWKRVLRFVSPEAFPFALLFSTQFIVRTALDWFRPTADFHARATVSTVLSAVILLAAGFSATWRSGSFAAGAVSGMVTASLAATISLTGAAVLLMIWHDPQTMAAIRGSGGLEEVFSLPLMLTIPGVILGSVGGIACIATKRAFST